MTGSWHGRWLLSYTHQVFALPALQRGLALAPVGHGLPQPRPERRAVVPLDQVADLVGNDVLHGHRGGLDQPPVDPDHLVLAAGTP